LYERGAEEPGDVYGDGAARHVTHGSALLYAQSLIMSACGFVFWFYATKITSTTFVGEISSLYLLSSLATTLLTFSIPSVAQRYIPLYEAKGKRAESVYVARLLVAAGFAISLAVWGFIYFLAGPLALYFLKGEGMAPIIRSFSFAVFFGLFSAFFSGLLIAHQRFKLYSVVNSVYYVAFYFGALLALSMGLGLPGVIWAWTMANAAFLLTFAFASFKHLLGEAGKAPIREMLRYGVPLYASSIISYGSSLVDRYVVLFLSTLGTLGIYNIAISSSGVVNGFLGAAMSVTYPFLSGMFGKRGDQPLKDAVRLSIRYLTFVFVPLALGASSIAAPVLSFFGSGQYRVGALPLSTVLLFSALTLAGGIYANALLAKGKSHTVLVASSASLAANVALSYAMIRPLGMEGAALGLSSSSVAYFVIVAYYAHKEGVFDYDAAIAMKSWCSSAIMAASVLGVQVLFPSPYFLPVYIIVGAAVWIGVSRLLKPLNAEDARLIQEITPSWLKGTSSLLMKLLGTEK